MNYAKDYLETLPTPKNITERDIECIKKVFSLLDIVYINDGEICLEDAALLIIKSGFDREKLKQYDSESSIYYRLKEDGELDTSGVPPTKEEFQKWSDVNKKLYMELKFGMP